MSEETDNPPYYAYMLRLWRSESQGRRQWRASLESPHTGERLLFSHLQQLFTFLSEQCEGEEPGWSQAPNSVTDDPIR